MDILQEPSEEYLHWAKTHRRVRYELTGSGVPPADADDFDTPMSAVSLQVKGAYGDPQLIEALAARYNVPPDGIIPVTGASSGIFIALATSAGHGDGILVEHPVYDPISRVAAFLGLKVSILQRWPEAAFDVLTEDIEAWIGRGARAVVLTNLHNPSGQYLSQEAVQRIAQQCASAGATLIVDEVYLDAVGLVTGQPLWSAASVGDNVIAIGSLTKVYGLGGLRVGWLMTSPALAQRARQVIDLVIPENSAPSTSIALEAFAQINQFEDRYRRFHCEGQPVYRRWLEEEPLVRGYDDHGSIFVCMRLPAGVKPTALNDHLVTEYDTQVVPGEFFGLTNHIRLNVAVPPKNLTEALSRVSQALRGYT
ncbi:MAG: pyridoxal phosphate-dependent aminotransferase [Phycisphaerales bacterium]|nr:MAG: pyridoxal phosphate-dependent aminotransferase [Phycisphaerales bacterium]